MSLDYLKGKKILLVDDEDDLLEMLRSILQDDGYRRIRTASTQKDALELCRTWKPELAVLDVMLPDGDGYTLFKEIRRFSDFPVLFLTARGEDEDRFRGLGLGADDYIVKPFLDVYKRQVWRIVVFPAPFAPISAMTSPSFTSKDIPLIAWITP